MGARGTVQMTPSTRQLASGQLAQFRTRSTKRGPGVRGLWVHKVDPTGIQNLNGTACRAQWVGRAPPTTVQTHLGELCVLCVLCAVGPNHLILLNVCVVCCLLYMCIICRLRRYCGLRSGECVSWGYCKRDSV